MAIMFNPIGGVHDLINLAVGYLILILICSRVVMTSGRLNSSANTSIETRQGTLAVYTQ